MLKKIYHALVPGCLQQNIREKSPYYQRYQELRKLAEADAAAHERETADLRTQLQKKEEEFARLSAESERVQSELRTELQHKTEESERVQSELRTQLQQKEEEFARLSAESERVQSELRTQLQQKEEEFARLSAESERVQSELRTELQQKTEESERALSELRTQLQQKEEEFARLSAESERALSEVRTQLQHKTEESERALSELHTQLQHKTGENARLLAEHQRETDALKQKILCNYDDYRNSMKRILNDPSVREDHLCGICGSLMEFSFSKKVMDKYEVSYFYCDHCGHLQTEKPYWLEEAYNSPLSDSDTGQVWRNERNRDVVCAAVHRFMPQTSAVLEYAGGYGLLTRMLRDSGMECFWYDKYAENTFARHFADDGKRKYDLVLAFEALEHFEEPMQEFEKIFRRADSLLFSETLLPEPCPNQWWYLCSEHGQHVSFYALKTLRYIAERFHKNLYFHEDVGLLTPLELRQEDFDALFAHVEENAAAFRAAHTPLMLNDMNKIINEMKRS